MKQIFFYILLFLISVHGIAQNTGINTVTPNANADLELGSTNKGLVLNNVQLQSTDNPAPLSTHVPGMIVYNISTSGTPPTNVQPGPYYNTGVEWVSLKTLVYNVDANRGVIEVFGGLASNIPPGWLECNGQAVSRTTYAALFAIIGTTYGTGNGSTTFNLPDLRGEFVRGWDNGRGVDPGRVLFSAQGNEIENHNHAVWDFGRYTQADQPGTAVVGISTTGSLNGFRTGTFGGSETRPRNKAMIYIIKY